MYLTSINILVQNTGTSKNRAKNDHLVCIAFFPSDSMTSENEVLVDKEVHLQISFQGRLQHCRESQPISFSCEILQRLPRVQRSHHWSSPHSVTEKNDIKSHVLWFNMEKSDGLLIRWIKDVLGLHCSLTSSSAQ